MYSLILYASLSLLLGGVLFELFIVKSEHIAKEIEKNFHKAFKGVHCVYFLMHIIKWCDCCCIADGVFQRQDMSHGKELYSLPLYPPKERTEKLLVIFFVF